MNKLNNKKILMVIASEGFQDYEYEETRKVLESAGTNITLASSKLVECIGKFGLKTAPDILINDAKVADFDAIVFIGGPGSEEYFSSDIAHNLARDFHNQGKLVAAICAAPIILAKAGLLSGKKATVFDGGAAELHTGGAEYTGADVEFDSNIITASGPPAAIAFGEKIVDMLQ